jgi:hypothetical protein
VPAPHRKVNVSDQNYRNSQLRPLGAGFRAARSRREGKPLEDVTKPLSVVVKPAQMIFASEGAGT